MGEESVLLTASAAKIAVSGKGSRPEPRRLKVKFLKFLGPVPNSTRHAIGLVSGWKDRMFRSAVSTL
jgi:hypothetical protein